MWKKTRILNKSKVEMVWEAYNEVHGTPDPKHYFVMPPSSNVDVNVEDYGQGSKRKIHTYIFETFAANKTEKRVTVTRKFNKWEAMEIFYDGALDLMVHFKKYEPH
ncbi:unnamed protein product [Camellia sinensis]